MTRIGSLATAPATPGLNYNGEIRPEKFEGMREWRLAKPLGLSQFGVNQVTLQPGAWSSLRHWHEKEDEFVYVLDGLVTLVDNNGPHELKPADFARSRPAKPTAITCRTCPIARPPTSRLAHAGRARRPSTIPKRILVPSVAKPPLTSRQRLVKIDHTLCFLEAERFVEGLTLQVFQRRI